MAGTLARSSRTGIQTGVARTLLLDTGFLVALVDPRDRDHQECLSVWSELRARFVSAEGVLVEAAHLLRKRPGTFERAVNIVRSVETTFVHGDAGRFDRAVRHMKRYQDVPMDFVDAMLVTIAEDAQVGEVLTLDRRGFETYRYGGKRRFTLLP